jgi:hypothetical protein
MVPLIIADEIRKYQAAPLLPDIKPAPERAIWFLTENFAWVMTAQRSDGVRDIIVRIKL